MKDRFPSLIALFLLLVLVASTYWAADYAQRAIQTDPPRRVTHEMDAWSRNFVMLRTDPTGRPINRLEGDYAEHFPDDDSYHITQPRAIGQREASPITVGVSKTAVMEQGGKRIVMNGDAHVHRQPDANNDVLDVRSQQLILLPDDDVVYTDLPAEVIKGPLAHERQGHALQQQDTPIAGIGVHRRGNRRHGKQIAPPGRDACQHH